MTGWLTDSYNVVVLNVPLFKAHELSVTAMDWSTSCLRNGSYALRTLCKQQQQIALCESSSGSSAIY